MLPLRAAISMASLALAPLTAACQDGMESRARVVRIGHFPNVTHAHALVARAMAAEGKGWFEERLGADVKIEWFTYNAGPLAMEALLAGSLDAAYVGPSPALNAHVRCQGKNVRVLAGATRGGSALVVRSDGGLTKPEDFRGKTIATPQLGNTQDVACRAFFVKHGFRVTQTGGDVRIVPTASPDQLDLFRRGEIDAAWTVEPWVSRLEFDAVGRVLLEERESLTTLLTASTAFLEHDRPLAAALVQAHRELTTWIARNPERAREYARRELEHLTRRPIGDALFTRCWTRLRVCDDASRDELEAFVREAKAVGFLKHARDLSRLVLEVP